MDRTEQLRTQSISKLIFNLSAPAIFAFMVSTLNIALDRIFIGKAVGTEALAAVSVAMGIQLLLQAFSQIIAGGASAAIAIELGKNNKEKAEKMIGNAYTLSIIMSIILTVLGCIFLKPILTLYGATDESMQYAMPYTLVMFIATMFFINNQVLNNIIRGMGYSKKATYNFLTSIGIHAMLDIVFLFGLHLGIKGAAMACSIGYLVSNIIAIRFLTSNKTVAKLHRSYMRIDKSIAKTIISVGVPAFIMQITISIISMVFNRVSNQYGGSIGQASYGVIYTLLMMVYMPIIGLSQGIQSIVGVNFGAKQNKRVKETLIKSLKYATVFSLVMFGFMEIFSHSLALLFGGAQDVALVNMTTNGMRVIGLSIPFVGFQMISARYFQFIGKSKQSGILSGLRQCILLVPLAVILPIFFGMTGVFGSFVVSDLLSLILTVFWMLKEFRNLDIQIDQEELGLAQAQ
ncbi:MATE family efflux transporter [Inconstantimicrobium mannanitabidum]|uniref:MATE family efflux transporter n=1 Tax=Inconstantimicrobium mannanitabidum TaxID=1604901 RepID=A0ACB5R9M4_9CLOT|nr:MATE family efflux transporter [Clostridium sp. TW13]GKX65898.1 MATE family efflux transporter [Clostridium sp. TW13]